MLRRCEKVAGGDSPREVSVGIPGIALGDALGNCNRPSVNPLEGRFEGTRKEGFGAAPTIRPRDASEGRVQRFSKVGSVATQPDSAGALTSGCPGDHGVGTNIPGKQDTKASFVRRMLPESRPNPAGCKSMPAMPG